MLIDFTNPSNLYLATARPGGCFFADVLLYKSTNGGANWNQSINRDGSGCDTNPDLMVMDPTDPNTIYLGNGYFDDGFGLVKSTDASVHWNSTGFSANLENALVIDPITPANLYAATDSGVQQSTDGGATWNVVGLANQNVSLLAIDPLQPNVLYAGVTAGSLGFVALLKSTDSGASWSAIDTGLDALIGTNVNVSALLLDPDNPDVLYLGTSGYGVFKTSDAGATWALFNDGLTFLDVRVLAIARGASPTLYAGTPGGVFKLVEQAN